MLNMSQSTKSCELFVELLKIFQNVSEMNMSMNMSMLANEFNIYMMNCGLAVSVPSYITA